MGRSVGVLRDFNPQNLANTLWALATLHYSDNAFVPGLLKEAARQLPEFNPQDLTNVVWALASLKHRDERFTQVEYVWTLV